jgi:hypothetical protein
MLLVHHRVGASNTFASSAMLVLPLEDMLSYGRKQYYIPLFSRWTVINDHDCRLAVAKALSDIFYTRTNRNKRKS